MLQRIECNFYWKLKLLKQADYMGMSQQNYRNMLKPLCTLPQIPFHGGFFKKKKGAFRFVGNFVILYKLAKFHCHAVFTSLVIE